MLPKQANVVGDGERLLREARDGLHYFIVVNMYSEISAFFRFTCHYFCTLEGNGSGKRH